MADLFETMEEKIAQWRTETRQLIKENSPQPVSEVTLGDILRGLRGVAALLCDTSYVDPEKGLYIRQIPVSKLVDSSPEEVFFLLCTGETPDEGARQNLIDEMKARRRIPKQVWDLIRSAPSNASMMSLLSMSVLSMQGESKFNDRYKRGLKKEDMWHATLEDALDLTAKLPGIAAGLYRLRVMDQDPIPDDDQRDVIENFVHVLGLTAPAESLCELFRYLFIVQSDHEGGNVCNITCQIVNSVLSDPYFAYSAGVNGLAGPLHGSASQQMVKLILEIQEKYGQVPDVESLRSLVNEWLDQGKIVPGFGHAVLRGVDPRFTALHAFGKRYCHNDPLFQTADKLFEVVTDILRERGKVSMPYPNVDAISGPLLYHFGIRNLEYYPVVFAISMALGMCAQMVINRALMMPIFRPRSITSEQILEMVEEAANRRIGQSAKR